MSEGNASAGPAVDDAEVEVDNVQDSIDYRRRSKRATLPANVAASQPVDGTGNQAAEGAGMEAGDVAGRPSKRKRFSLPGNADGQSDDVIPDDESDNGDEVASDETDDEEVYSADLCRMQSLVERRLRLQKKNVCMIRRSLIDMRSGIAQLQKTLESNRDFLLGALQTSYQKCEDRLKLFAELLKCKAAHEQAVNEALSELKEDKNRLLKQHEESRKNDENLASAFVGEIDKLLAELKKRDKGDKRTAKLAMMCGGLVKKLSV